MEKTFPVIDLAATGENIASLRKDRGMTVRDLQRWFGFEEPQAIYKWQKGKSLPTVEALTASRRHRGKAIPANSPGNPSSPPHTGG